MRQLASIVLIGLAVGGACSARPVATPTSTSTRCMEFPNEIVDAIAWRADGAQIAVATYDLGSGNGVIRLVSYPELKEVAEIRRSLDVLSAHGIAAGPDGYAWIEHANGGANVVMGSADDTDVVGYVNSSLYSLRSRGATLFAVHERLDGQIVQLDQSGVGLTVKQVTTVDGIVESFDVTPDGRMVYLMSKGPGTPLSIVVLNPSGEQTFKPSGHLVGKPTFSADGSEIYLEDHDAGVLRAIRIADGSERVVLREDVSVVAVAPSGAIAHTWVAPTDTHQLCVEEAAGVPAASS